MKTNGTFAAAFRIAALCGAAGALLSAGLIPIVAPPAGASGSAKLVFTTTPGTAKAGTAFGRQPVIKVENSSGTATTGNNGTITLTVNGGTPITGCHQVESAGVVTFSGCEIDKAGTGYTLNAVESGYTSATSGTFNVASGKATTILFTAEPTTITAGHTFSPVIKVKVEDAKGNPATTSAIKVELTAIQKTGQGPLLCTGSGESTPTSKTHTGAHAYQVSPTSGVGTFSDCTVDVASSATYHLVAVATLGGSSTLQVESTAFKVNIGPASQLAFITDPTGAELDQAFGVQPAVAVEDAAGNIVSTTTGTVSLAITSGKGPSGAALQNCAGGTLTTGKTTFTGCSIDKIGSGYSLTASLASPAIHGTSRPFAVSSGPASTLTFATEPGNATGGSPFSKQPVVTITDSSGDPVSGTVQLSIEGTPSGVALSCAPNPDPAGTGTATFTNCAVNKAGSYHLVATDPAAPGITAVSDAFTISTGPAAQVIFTHSPSSSSGGVAFGTQPTVSVEDLGGNPVHGSVVTLGIAPGTGTTGAQLTCTGDAGDQATAASGTVTFSGCSINLVGATYELTATSGSVTGDSAPFSVTLGTPTKLVFSEEPSGGTVGTPFGGQPQVTITDAGGNPESDAGVAVTLSVSSGTASLTCSTNPVTTNGTGTAIFIGCKATAAGPLALRAGVSGNTLSPATSPTFTITSGAALGVTPVGVPIGQTYGGSATLGANPTSVTDDVNDVTGALDVTNQDLKMAGVGESFTLTREYNSNDTTAGSFGPGWSSILDAGVHVATNGTSATVRGADGQLLVFTSNGSGGWNPPAGARSSLSCQGTLCTVTQDDGTVFQSIGGQIQDYLSPDGVGLHFVYSQGHLVQITGSAKTLVSGVEASLGTQVGAQGWASSSAGGATLNAVAASSPTQLWAVGDNCTVEFSNNGGVAWAADPNVSGCASGATLTGVASEGSGGPVFAVGTGGTVLVCAAACNASSAKWVRPTSGSLPPGTVNLTAVWSSDPNYVYAVGTTTGGAGQIWACSFKCGQATATSPGQSGPLWSNVTPSGLTSSALTSISGQGTSLIVAVGADGTILVCSASTCPTSAKPWTRLHAGSGGNVPHSTVTFTGVSVADFNHVYAVGTAPGNGGPSGVIWACSANCASTTAGPLGPNGPGAPKTSSWANVTPPGLGTTPFTGVTAETSGPTWATSSNGQIWYCPSNCATVATDWVSLGTPGSATHGLFAITSGDATHADAVGAGGTVATTNGTTVTLNALEQGIGDLGTALAPGIWTDGNDLSSTQGKQLFIQAQRAIQQLWQLAAAPPPSGSKQPPAQPSIANVPGWDASALLDLTQAMRIVDANTLSENITSPRNAGALSTAEKQFAAGNSTISSGQYPPSVGDYQLGWTKAVGSFGTGQSDKTPLQISVTENAAGEVTSIHTPTRTVAYRYTGSLLSGFTDADSNAWTYQYSSGPTPALTKVIDPTDVTRLTVTYSGGRVASASSLGSKTHFVDTYSWNPGTQTSTRSTLVQLAAGVPSTTAQSFAQTSGNVLLAQQQPDGATTSYSYDANVNLTGTQQPNGQVQRMTYDPNGDLLTQSGPADGGTSLVTFTYNGAHQTLSDKDANGNTTTYTYTGGNLVQETPPGPSSGATHYRFNYLGEQYEATGPTSSETFAFDSAGNQTGYQLLTPQGHPLDGLGPVFRYDEAGQKTLSTSPRGHLSNGLNPAYQTTNVYNADGQLVSTTAPGSQTTSTTYAPGGTVKAETDPPGEKSTYSWNESKLQLTSTGPSGTTVSTYDPSGQLLTQVTPSGATTSYTYDTSGGQVSKTGPTGVATTYAFNIEGDETGSTTSSGDTSSFAYDAANQETSSTSNGVTTSTSYDPAGNVTSQTDADGRVTMFTYNSHEQLASVKTTAGTTSYTYDLEGNLIAVKDGNGHTISYQVNGAGERTQMTVSGNKTTYTYDTDGNLISSTDPDGRTTRYRVNAVDERTAITYSQSGQPTISVTQTFNAKGQRTRVTDTTTGTTTYTYDANGQLASSTGANGTYSYTYKTPGKMTETYPDGTPVTYTYDDADLLMGVSAPGVSASYVRNGARQITGIAYSNGTLQTQSYDQAGLVTSEALSCGGTTELTRATTYDTAGDPLAEATTVGSTTTTQRYGYDASARTNGEQTATTVALTPLPDTGCTTGHQSSTPAGNDTSGTTTDATTPTTANQPVTPAEGTPGRTAPANAIHYDAVGDITSINGISISYKTTDEVTNETGTGHASYTYDKNGDVTTKTVGGVTTTYSYNAADELVGVTKSGKKTTYTYDGDANRATKTTTGTTVNYSWDPSGSLPLLTLICHGTCTTKAHVLDRFIYGAGPVAMQTATATYYLTEDQEGDVIAVSNDKGKVVESYSYDALGNVTATHFGTGPVPNEPLLFQGQFLDTTTGLYDMRARNYDPASGTFTQRDPVQPAIGTPVFSPYALANDQAPASADPTGDLTGSGIVDAVYYGHSTQTADIVGVTRDFVGVTVFTLKSGQLISKYMAKAESAATDVEDAASAIKSLGPEYAADAEAVTADLGGASEAGLDLAKGAGRVLGVAALALGIYLTVEDCEHGTVSQCVGDSVGLALGVACTVVTEGAGALACGMAAAAIGMVISKYGPEIVEGLADLGTYEIQGFNDAVAGIEQGYEDVGEALTGAYGAVASALTKGFYSAEAALTSVFSSAKGIITTGFNELDSYISSGFASALSTLEDAGETAAQMADVLKDYFNEGLDAVVNQLIDLRYDVDGIASALEDAFGKAAAEAAAILQQFEYTFNQIGQTLDKVFDEAAAVAGQILQTLGATLDDVVNVLTSIYTEIASKVATVLKTLNYTINQIATVLSSVFSDALSAVATILKKLTYAITAIAGALKTAFTAALHGTLKALANLISTAFNALGITLTGIAKSLFSALGLTATQVASILKTVLNVTAAALSTALEGVYGLGAQAVAGILSGLSYLIGTIENVLTSLFHLSVSTIESVLGNFFSNTVISTLGGAFSAIVTFLTTVATFLTTVGTTISSWF